jgi:cytochrome c
MSQLRFGTPPAVLLFLASILVFLVFGCSGGPQVKSALVFSKTAGFRHGSIEAGQEMFRQLAAEKGFTVEFSEDSEIFNQQDLSRFNLVVFLSTTGDILNPQQESELRRFMQAGGNWMGIHAAADTEYNWPWYNELVGGYFNGHPNNPNVRQADVLVDVDNHPATRHLDPVWPRKDEWYNYKNLQEDITTLMRVDETTYEGGTNGEFHPISWYKEIENGRMFYTGLGHTDESFSEPDFVAHIAGALEYLFGEGRPVDYSGVRMTPEENRFQVEALVTGMTEPMELELLPDGRPIWVERSGNVMVYDPDFDQKAKIAEFDVWTEFEDGLLGIALDPDFEDNQWLYFYYSPNIEESLNRLSRFQFTGSGIDMDSEQIILEVPTDRNECCHSGGSIEFGPTGLLHLSIGDNTNPHQSDGYAPIDDSRQDPNFDARRSSANTMDLRGGIVRIKVEEDGSYSIPEGNLFTDPEEGRPEIYAMGMRNPFRIHVDQRNGNVYWGDVGPDAGKDSVGMGPRGHDEVNVATEAGFFGWPLFIGDNKPYHARDFATGSLGGAFDPKAPVNDSKLNTGARELPPAQPAMIYYPYARSEEFPALGDGGRNAMAGPVFYRDDYNEAETRFPEYYDGKFFFYDWMRDYIMAATLDETGYVTEFEPFLPGTEFLHPMDMLFGPDGDLYVIEYGRKWFSENSDARLLRIKYIDGNRPPVPEVQIAQDIGAAPFSLVADASNSLDYDGDELSVTWLLNDEEIGTGKKLEYTIEERAVHQLVAILDDGQGNEVRSEHELMVGNSLPQVAINLRGNRSFFFPGQEVFYEVMVSDEEDGTMNQGIAAEAVTVTLDYLEGEDLIKIERGHQVAGKGTAFAIGKSLIDGSDCSGCHAINEASIGPPYQKVADRYRKDPNGADYLAGKIINGGGGVWGETAMSAHPDLSEADAKKMAEYILSLAGPAPNVASRPTSGKIALDKHRAGIPGRYYLQASYTDEGAGDLPRLTTREVIKLRSPFVPAHLFKSGNKVMAYHIEAKDNPMGDEDADVLVATGGGWVSYGALDLRGLRGVKAIVALAPGITSGGTIEIVAGHPTTGEVVGTYLLEQKISTYGVNEVEIPLEGSTEGEEPIFFRFKADSEEATALMGVVIGWEFLPGQLTK